MSQLPGTANKPGEPDGRTAAPVRSTFEEECARLKLVLADQIERQALREARQTATAILCLDPTDLDALGARALLDEQLAVAPPHPVGEVHCLSSHRNWVNCVVFSPDGRFALSGGGGGGSHIGAGGGLDRSIRLWEVETGREFRRYLGRLGMVTGIAFTPDAKQAVSSNLGGGVHLWDVESGDTVRRFDPSVSQVHCVAVSPDGRWVFAGGEDCVIHQWDAATGARARRFIGHTQMVSSIALSPDGKHLLSGGWDESVRLWDAGSGQLLRSFEGHTQPVLGVAISNDGRHALSAGLDSTVRLWDCEGGRELVRLKGHRGPVNAVAFSPDGQRAVSGGADGTVRLWDLASGRELKCFHGHRDQVASVACSTEGYYALSGSRDATARLWQLPIAGISSVPAEALELLDSLPYPTVGHCIDELLRLRIFDAAQQAALDHAMRARFTAPKALLQHLIESGWLTTYQVGELAERRGDELRLGDYVLRESLGEGGMGQVFKARRFGTAQDVALKIVLPELTSDREALQQFQWEIRALSQMSHPNIIKTYDAGQDRDRHFFTMEYVEGIDLYQLMKRFGPLPLERAVDYVRQAALGLEHAHEHCLIHRDIKPANLFLTFPRGEGWAEGEGPPPEAVLKVLDWGLAGLRLPKGRQASSVRTTPREDNVGTADYISPEQATNSTGADIRTDIYSLGCTLYHLLAGAPPFPGKSVMQKLLKHQKEEALPIQKVRPDVPDSIAQAIHKMMSKRPEDRYPAPAVVAVALTMKR